MHATMAFFGGYLGVPEIIVILVLALLIFGRRLPEVGRSLGRGLVEFKKGVRGLKDELDEVDREVDEASREDESPRQQIASKPDETVPRGESRAAEPAGEQPASGTDDQSHEQSRHNPSSA